jgi:hydroxypyruvate reductase
VQLIQNKAQLYNKKTKDALQILEAGLEAASPENFLVRYVANKKLVKPNARLSKFYKIYIVAVGKAADSMANYVHKKINSDGGLIIIPQTHRPVFSNKKFKIIRSSHPIPNQKSIIAAKSLTKFLQNTRQDDLVVFLVSGGTSPLVCMPYGVTLKQKQALTQKLLTCGATIKEINALRKHLSRIKGGRVLENLNCMAVSYVMSDVVGDDLSSIASGLTYCDTTTYADCLKIIEKYGLADKIPKAALRHLRSGAMVKIPETPKVPKIPNYVIASNKDCLVAMAKKAKSLGYKTKMLQQLTGDIKNVTNRILRNPPKPRSCLLFGGEPTVKVAGRGRGGRNQELVLRLMKKSKPQFVMASVGTDGIDGNTKYAGAIYYGTVQKNEIDLYLKNNDSNSFFKKHGGLIKTGPTHTNLMDIGLIMTS